MTLIDLGSSAAEPVPFPDLKRWCRIDRDDEDALVVSLGRAAREAVEAATGIVLTRRAFRLVVEAVPADRWIRVDRRPVAAVTRLVAFGPSGTPTVYGPEAAVIERVGDTQAFRVSPAVLANAANGLEIEFEAGFAAEDVPEALRMAIRRIVSASYELRGALDPSQQPGFVPPAALALLAPFRRMRI